ncbi:MAG: UvrB/UvrC motif-containing protein [Planctomycetota bacterium]
MSDEGETPCESCGERRATWHLTNLVDGEPVQHHLCDECYAEQSGGQPQVQGAFAQLIAAVVPELRDMALRQCPECGLNYLEFRQTFRLGCPHDYEAFDKALEQLLERIHGASSHTGKVPPTAGEEEAMRSRLRSLRKQQRKAIAEENYELAAELRDNIRELEEHGFDAAKG